MTYRKKVSRDSFRWPWRYLLKEVCHVKELLPEVIMEDIFEQQKKQPECNGPLYIIITKMGDVVENIGKALNICRKSCIKGRKTDQKVEKSMQAGLIKNFNC